MAFAKSKLWDKAPDGEMFSVEDDLQTFEKVAKVSSGSSCRGIT
jgi:hypothetical protein